MNLIEMETLKAMECCTKFKYACPEYCPRYNNTVHYVGECRFKLLKDVSKLFKAREEEIARLHSVIAAIESGKTITPEKAIDMIEEYIQEPNSISADWVEALKLCRDALRKEVK